jgi:Transglycosylase SLT domain
MMRYAKSLIIVLLANQVAIAAAAAGERIILRDPATIFGQKHPGQRATQAARMTPVKPLDRVASAVDGAESSHGKDIAMWRPDPSGPQGPMQVSEAAATDVGGGDRFDLSQNRVLGRAYLAQLYGRYKNWPDAIAAYNWGPRNIDTWVKAGRPLEKLLAGVAAYTTRVLHDSGLCDSVETIPLQRSVRSDGDPEFRAAIAGPFAHVIFGHFGADGGAFTGDQQYFCGTVSRSFSRVGPLRSKEAGVGPRSLFEQITASARLSWRRATQRYGTQVQATSSDANERLDWRAAGTHGHSTRPRT